MTYSILIAMLTGLIAGRFLPELYPIIQPLGMIFLNLLQCIMIPLVLGSLISGTIQLSRSGAASGLGWRILLYFLGGATLAASLGILWGSVLTQGDAIQQSLTSTQQVLPGVDLSDLINQLIPRNPIQAIASGNLLGIVFIGCAVGMAIGRCGTAGQALESGINSLNAVMSHITGWVMRVAPVGVGVLMMGLVATTGLAALHALLYYSIAVMLGLLSISLLMFILLYYTGNQPLALLNRLSTGLLTAFTTASSSSVLPLILTGFASTRAATVSRIVMPLGTTLNMTGTALYLSLTSVFLAHVYGVTLSGSAYGIIIGLSVISAVSAAGIPSASLITMSLILSAIAVPVESIGMIIGIDRLLDMMRTTVNVWCNSAITVLLSDLPVDNLA